MLAITDGAPFALLKTGHLLHHRFSRTRRERTEIDAPVLLYYGRLLGGLYLAEVATVALAAAPARLWSWLARRYESPATVTGLVFETVARRHLRAFRLDALIVVVAYGLSGIAYGRDWWMLVAAVLGRAVLISVADNAYHYGTRLEAPLEAMNLGLPRPLEAFVLAFNLHNVHHRHPGVPWWGLRAAYEEDGDEIHLCMATAVTRQFRGPIPADHVDVRPIPVDAPIAILVGSGASAKSR